MGCNGRVGLSAGRRVAGGDSFWLRPVRPDGCLPGPDDADVGVGRTPGNKHQYPEVVREKVKVWSTLAGCGEIQDGIERQRVKRSVSGGVRDGEGIGRGSQDGIRREHSNIGGNPVGGGCRAC